MAIFAVIAPPDNSTLGSILEAQYANNFLRVWNNQWIISANGTPKDISDKLGVSDGSAGTAMILLVTSYWGRANPDFWQWMSERLSSQVSR